MSEETLSAYELWLEGREDLSGDDHWEEFHEAMKELTAATRLEYESKLAPERW